MQSHRSFSRLGICDASLQLLYAKLEGSDIAGERAQGLVIEGLWEQSVKTHLLSLPRANWSLAAEQAFSRPAFSQAVQAGSFPSHCSQPSDRIPGEHQSRRCLCAERGSAAACPLTLTFAARPGEKALDLDLPEVSAQALEDGHSHLEQADTGLDTRKRGVCEKLLRGIARASLEDPSWPFEELKDWNGEPRSTVGNCFSGGCSQGAGVVAETTWRQKRLLTRPKEVARILRDACCNR